MITKLSSAVLAVTLTGAAAIAQDKTDTTSKPTTSLKVQVVFSRYQGEKKVASLPYILSVNADDRPAKVRMGIQVPLMYGSKDVPGNVIYKSVGSNLDCHVQSMADGRFKMNLTLEQSSVHSPELERPGSASTSREPATPPVLRTFNSEAGLVLRDGQSAQYTVATDPVSGEVLKVEVTLNVLK